MNSLGRTKERPHRTLEKCGSPPGTEESVSTTVYIPPALRKTRRELYQVL